MVIIYKEGDTMKKYKLNEFIVYLSVALMAAVMFLPFVYLETDAASSIKIGVSSSVSSQYVGSKITVKASGSGGTSPYKYKFTYRLNSGSWVTIKNYTASNTASLTASKAGTYTVRSYAKDKSNREIFCDLKITIKEKYVSLSNKSTVNSTSINKTQSITLKGSANGGTKPYSYKYYYLDQKGTQKIIKNYCSASSVSVKFPAAGYYTVHCAVKDKDGKVIDKSFNVTVKNNTGQVLKNTSGLSSYSMYVNNTVTINGSASGGNQPYQYEYYYSINNSSYKKIAGYTKSSKQTFKFTTAGYYKLKVIAKDFSGKTAETVKNVTVKQNTNKTLSITSSVDTTSLVDQNTTANITASGSGGTLPYRYAYYYKIDNGNWKLIKDYSTGTKATIKLSSRGMYTLKSVVMDSAGKTKEKTLTVTSITKYTSQPYTPDTEIQYGLSHTINLNNKGSGDQYEVYYRNPGSTQWNIIQKYGTNRTIRIRPRYLGTTSVLVFTKQNNKVTNTFFTLTTKIPSVVYDELALINQERKKAGLDALKLDNDLVFVACVRAEELEKKYSHDRPDGTKCFTVLNEYSIKSPTNAGENIAWGYPDVKSVVQGWMSSVKHRENILGSNYKKVGIGIYGKYWSQMFTS